MSYEVVEPSLD